MARENQLGFRKNGSGRSLGVITPSTREAQDQSQHAAEEARQQAELERQRREQAQRRDG